MTDQLNKEKYNSYYHFNPSLYIINLYFYINRGKFMTTNKDYIRYIREKVGHDLIFLNFAGGIIYNEQNEILLQKRGDRNEWGLPGGAMELGESLE